MAAVHSITEEIDRFYATTWQNMRDNTVDQIFDGSPFWFWMRENGRLDTVRGGRFIMMPLRYASSGRVTFIGRGGTVELSEEDFLTNAQWRWRYLVDSIVRFGVDDQQNAGKNQIINLAKAKMDQSKDSLIDRMETTLFGASATNEFEGLQTLVADDPTTSTVVGGINQSTHSWWQNQTKDMTGLSFAVHGHAEMRTMFNNCSKNLRQDAVDLIVSGQTPFEYYEDTVVEQKRIVNKKLGDAGFENIQFKGVPMIWSPGCAATRMYFLNTRFLRFMYDPTMFFRMTDWKPIPDQVEDRAAQIITAGNLVTNRRRVHGILHTIDTA